MRNRFTKVEDARLISLRQGGALWVQIGAALERSPGSCRVRLRLLEHRGECEPAPKAKRKASVKKHCLRCRSPFRTTQPRQIHMCEPCKVGIRRTGEGDYVEHGLSGTSGLDGAHQVSARRPNY